MHQVAAYQASLAEQERRLKSVLEAIYANTTDLSRVWVRRVVDKSTSSLSGWI